MKILVIYINFYKYKVSLLTQVDDGGEFVGGFKAFMDQSMKCYQIFIEDFLSWLVWAEWSESASMFLSVTRTPAVTTLLTECVNYFATSANSSSMETYFAKSCV